MEVTYN